MARCLGAVIGTCMLVAVMPASAQPAPRAHTDPICGLRFEYPPDWTERSEIHHREPKPAAGFTDSVDTPGISWQTIWVWNNTGYDVLVSARGTPVAGSEGTSRVGPRHRAVIPLGGVPRVVWTVADVPGGAQPDTPALDVDVESQIRRADDRPLTRDLIRQAEEPYWRIFVDSPEDTYVQVNGVWDTSAIGTYLDSGGGASGDPNPEPAVAGTLIQLLLSNKLPGSLAWIDHFRRGPMAISYLIQSQPVNGRPFYHLSALLIRTGAARGLRPNGWSYAVVGAWIPQEQYRLMEPRVMQIVRSIDFTKAEQACWRS